MEFCIISPTEGLEPYATRSKRHMALAHQVLKDEAYATFYRMRKAEGEFVILDNGVYENDFDNDAFLEAVDKLRPSLAVLPDVILGGNKSTNRSLSFLGKHAPSFPEVQWMIIPQGRTLSEWQYSLGDALAFRPIVPLWIGLTRFLPTHVTPTDPLIRVKLATYIREKDPDVRLHCMGMANGDLNEVRVLAKQGIVESIDSSAPVWRGWMGFDLEVDRAIWDQRGCEVNFAAKLEEGANKLLIERNLEAVLKECSCPTNQ